MNTLRQRFSKILRVKKFQEEIKDFQNLVQKITQEISILKLLFFGKNSSDTILW